MLFNEEQTSGLIWTGTSIGSLLGGFIYESYGGAIMFRSFGIYALIYGTLYALCHFAMDYKKTSSETRCKSLFFFYCMHAVGYWSVFSFSKDSLDDREREISVKGTEWLLHGFCGFSLRLRVCVVLACVSRVYVCVITQVLWSRMSISLG